MTLGGLALAVGILVDDATVEVENINRNREAEPEKDMDELSSTARHKSRHLPSFPRCRSALCLPHVLAVRRRAVSLCATRRSSGFRYVGLLPAFPDHRPTMAKYLLRGDKHEASAPSRNPLVRLQKRFEEAFERFRHSYRSLLEICLRHRRAFLIAFFASCLGSLAILIPWLGRDFFPSVDSGSFKLHLRAPTGMRIEETATFAIWSSSRFDSRFRQSEVQNVIDT